MQKSLEEIITKRFDWVVDASRDANIELLYGKIVEPEELQFQFNVDMQKLYKDKELMTVEYDRNNKKVVKYFTLTHIRYKKDMPLELKNGFEFRVYVNSSKYDIVYDVKQKDVCFRCYITQKAIALYQ